MSKILIVEDEVILREMYNKLLTNASYEVFTAVNGKQGLEIALKEKPDLILLDIKMPVMSGFEMLKELRRDVWGKGASVILLTNFDSDDQITRDVVITQPSYYLMKTKNRPQDVLMKIKEVLNEDKGVLENG